jgi:hypothetical protein
VMLSQSCTPSAFSQQLIKPSNSSPQNSNRLLGSAGRPVPESNTTVKSSIKIGEDVGHYELLINRGYQVTRETESRGFPQLRTTIELQKDIASSDRLQCRGVRHGINFTISHNKFDFCTALQVLCGLIKRKLPLKMFPLYQHGTSCTSIKNYETG